MPTYDYKCDKCNGRFEIKKRMRDPNPKKCILCKKTGGIVQIIHPPSITYADRPAWTYNDFKNYKTSSHNGGPRIAMDPNKVGDLACWNNPGKIAAPTRSDIEKAKKKKKILKDGGYMSDANKAVRGE